MAPSGPSLAESLLLNQQLPISVIAENLYNLIGKVDNNSKHIEAYACVPIVEAPSFFRMHSLTAQNSFQYIHSLTNFC